MSQSQPDRLDRIEATLEQVVQALNNQVAVNADLRSSIESMANNQLEVNAGLRSSIESMANNQIEVNADLRSSIESMANNQLEVNADLRSSVNSLIGIANQHQENFMVVVNELRTIRDDMRAISQRVDRLENQ